MRDNGSSSNEPQTATLTGVDRQKNHCFAELPCGRRIRLFFKRFCETVPIGNGTTSLQIGDNASGKCPSVRKGQKVIITLSNRQSKRKHPSASAWALAQTETGGPKPRFRNRDPKFIQEQCGKRRRGGQYNKT